MATVLSPDSTDFQASHTVAEAFDSLAELGDRATILAGGTDVMVQLLRGEIRPHFLSYIGHVKDFPSLQLSDDRVTLGPLTSHRSVATDAQVSAAVPALAEACATVGGWQTQEVGTVVGNVCNASPAADTIPPLLVANCVVNLGSRSQYRSLPLAEFVTGRRSTARRPDEMVMGLDVDSCGPGSGETYLKVAPRTAMEVALVGLAVRLSFAAGAVTEARVAVGAVAPVPFRDTEVESLLFQSNLSGEGIDEASARLAEHISPIDDARASASYRRKVTRRLLARAIELARSRATRG